MELIVPDQNDPMRGPLCLLWWPLTPHPFSSTPPSPLYSPNLLPPSPAPEIWWQNHGAQTVHKSCLADWLECRFQSLPFRVIFWLHGSWACLHLVGHFLQKLLKIVFYHCAGLKNTIQVKLCSFFSLLILKHFHGCASYAWYVCQSCHLGCLDQEGLQNLHLDIVMLSAPIGRNRSIFTEMIPSVRKQEQIPGDSHEGLPCRWSLWPQPHFLSEWGACVWWTMLLGGVSRRGR
jgi:hypothetical protein